jgi:hypothetical protein
MWIERLPANPREPNLTLSLNTLNEKKLHSLEDKSGGLEMEGVASLFMDARHGLQNEA